MKKICGIYKIICTITGNIYIGQGIDTNKRWRVYRSLHCKTQTKLYNSFLEYGVENHTFEIIHECKREHLGFFEIYYIDFFKTFKTEHGLNLTSGGSKAKLSEETKRKIGLSHKGKIVSKESRKRISESQTGEKNNNFGKPMPEEQRRKISEAQMGEKNHNFGKKNSEETKRKRSESLSGEKHYNFGKTQSEETKQKISKTLKGRELSEETKQKMSEAKKGKKAAKQKTRKPTSDEAKRNLSESAKGRKMSPESIIKQVETKARIKQERLTMIF